MTGTQGIADSYLLTIEAAIAHASADATNPRRGPYTLLVATGNSMTFERAMTPVAQQGVARQTPSVLAAIRNIIAYDGWTGTRGFKTTTYPGVATNKAYLISQQYRGQDFDSASRNRRLQNEGMERDISRFLTQSFTIPTTEFIAIHYAPWKKSHCPCPRQFAEPGRRTLVSSTVFHDRDVHRIS